MAGMFAAEAQVLSRQVRIARNATTAKLERTITDRAVWVLTVTEAARLR
jgi:hypothetical protein